MDELCRADEAAMEVAVASTRRTKPSGGKGDRSMKKTLNPRRRTTRLRHLRADPRAPKRRARRQPTMTSARPTPYG